jgi:hypothetical protein
MRAINSLFVRQGRNIFRRFVGMATLLAGCGQDAHGVDNLMFHVVP